jgi:hypothetical protein
MYSMLNLPHTVQTQETLVSHLLREIVNYCMKINLDNDVTKYMPGK